MSIRTLNEIFFTVVERNNDRVMLTRENEAWQPVSSAQLRSWVYSTARQLQAWGINKGDRVVILSENRVEWAITDYAALLLGAVAVFALGTGLLFWRRSGKARPPLGESPQS